MKQFFMGMLFIGVSWGSWAQVYIPMDTLDSKTRQLYIKEYEGIHRDFIAQIQLNYDKGERKQLLKTFEKVHANFIKSIDKGAFCYDTRFVSKLEEILLNIQNANPDLPKNLKILMAKQSEINAYNLGEGTIVINMGLFQYLENEDQLAGIIGHEIGHQVNNHVLQTQSRRFEIEQSKSKKAVREVKSQKYNRGEKALGLFKETLYAEGEERRKQELEADEKGYEIIKKTSYKPRELVRAFELMKEYDTLRFKGLKTAIYKQVFDLPKQPFNEKWLAKEDFSVYNQYKYVNKIDKDSIASHPELDERIQNLTTVEKTTGTSVASQDFLILKQIAKREQVPNLYFAEDYGAAVYISLMNIQSGEDVDYYKNWLGKLFNRIYDARKTYKLNRYLDTVTPKTQSDSYQQYLSFMWNLSLVEVKNIADFYSNLSE